MKIEAIPSGTYRDLVFQPTIDFNAFFGSLGKTTNILSPLLKSKTFFQIGATLVFMYQILYLLPYPLPLFHRNVLTLLTTQNTDIRLVVLCIV